MGELHIHLLGTFQVISNGEPLAGFRSSKVRALLAYLALAGERPHSRDTLAHLLWGEFDEQAAKINLRQSLSNLRQLLPTPCLTITPQTITFHTIAAVWVDAVAFQQLITDSRGHAHEKLSRCSECLARLVKAAALYRSELLTGFHLNDAPAFDAWRLPQQESLHQAALWVLGVLIESYDALGQPDEQIACLRQQIGLEPWHESAHRQLMELLARQGRRSQALAQYETCRRILADELGVEPTAETMALMKLIEADRLPPKTMPKVTAVPGHNLPAAMTTFVGRASQLAELCARLPRPETRLVTIVGLAGTGKTRLAQATASRLLPDFPQGVWYVPLASLALDEAEIQGRLATAVLCQLPLSAPTTQEPLLTLCDFLRPKKLLLVLDNLEHLLPAAVTVVVELLNQAPQLTILTTSQVRLNCQAETLLPLDGLAVPTTPDDDPMAIESVQLFVERARRHYPGFAPAADDWQQMATLCRLLEGLPLAIELAASQAAHYSLAEMVAAIEQNLNILTSTMQDLPPRQRTMQAAFHYAWQLLTPLEQRVLAQLSLFPGEFGREAALAVTEATVTDLVGLVNRSLLRLVGPGRYVLHGLIHQFTAEMLLEKPEAQALAQARYGRYYLAFLQQQCTLFDTPHETQALLAVSREIDNIRPLWRWLSDRADWEGIGEAMTGLMNFFSDMGRPREGLLLVEEALNQLPNPDDTQVQVWARLRCWQAIFLYRNGRYAQAETQLHQLLPTFQANGDFSFLALALFTLGRLALQVGSFEAGYGWLQQALARYEALGNVRGISRTLNQLARYYEMVGQFAQARAHYADCLELNQRGGAPRVTAVTLNNLGLLLHRLGEYAEAQALLQESIAIYRTMDNEFEVAAGLSNLALVLIELAAYDQARALLQQAQQIQETLGYRYRLAIVLNNLGDVANLQERFAEAEAYLKQSIRLKRELGNEQGLTFSLVHLGQSYLGLKEYDKARTCFMDALRLSQKLALPPLALEAVMGMAQLKAVTGSKVEALQLLQLPLRHAAAWQRTRREAQALATAIGGDLEEGVRQTAVAAAQTPSLEEVTTRLLTTQSWPPHNK